jgi:hypothetical protein
MKKSRTFFALLMTCTLLPIATSVASAANKKQSGLDRGARKQAEQMLADLGYWTGRVDGVWDESSRHALTAFQKAENRERTGKLTLDEIEAIEAASPVEAREGGPAHFEVDLTRQILFYVDDDGATSRVIPISSGNGEEFFVKGFAGVAYTPRGRFQVQRKISGWRKSDLGMLYYPSYIYGGVAIHGSTSIPTSPASHGCIRVPMYAAKQLSDLMPVETIVFVYE